MLRSLVHFIYYLERLPRQYACFKSPFQIPLFVLLFLPSRGKGRIWKKQVFEIDHGGLRKALSDLKDRFLASTGYTCTICLIKVRKNLLSDLIFKSLKFVLFWLDFSPFCCPARVTYQPRAQAVAGMALPSV
jgi:hypothetical protein